MEPRQFPLRGPGFGYGLAAVSVARRVGCRYSGRNRVSVTVEMVPVTPRTLAAAAAEGGRRLRVVATQHWPRLLLSPIIPLLLLAVYSYYEQAFWRPK